MDKAVRDRAIYAFGPFRLDATLRVLTRDGVAISLTPTVFDTLLHFVENPGRLISREELLDAIWPGRVVEEANVSQTIFTLRKALGVLEGADGVIATAPGRGYRLQAVVRREAVGPPPEAFRLEPEPPRGSIPLWARAGAGLLAAAGLGLWILHPWRAPPPPPAPRLVVLAAFQNLTGEAIFDRTLAKVLEIDLDQSPVVNVAPERQVQETLLLMTRPKDEALTPAVAGEVCARNGGAAVVTGGIAALGAHYLLTLEATDCAGERVLAAEKAEVAGREAVVPALDGLIRRIRGRLGEPGASIARFDIPLARERTSSLAALKAFSEASYLAGHGQGVQAIPLFRHAIDLDPDFATAHAALGAVLYNLGQRDAAAASITRAFALRAAANEREKFHIVTLYNGIVTRDYDETIRNSRAWAETYPTDYRAWINLANALNWIGRYPEAVAAGRRTRALEGGAESSYAVLARALMHAGQLDEASVVCAAAAAKGVAGDQIQGLVLEIASARGDRAAIDRAVAAARGKPAERDVVLFAAHDAYRRGQARRGEALYAQAAELGKDQDLADTTLASRARDLADLGLADQARALLAAVPADTGPGDYLFTLADLGDAGQAEALMERDLKAAPADTLLMAVFAPEVRAALALRRGHPAEAVESLRPALPYEGRDNDIPYLRGRAYLAAGDGAHAVLEFRKILDHPGVEPASPLHPLARLGLARAERLAGDIPASRRTYQAFLADWKDADPDLPILLAARAEYGALTR